MKRYTVKRNEDGELVVPKGEKPEWFDEMVKIIEEKNLIPIGWKLTVKRDEVKQGMEQLIRWAINK